MLYYSATTSINPTTLLQSYSTTQYYFPFLCLKHEVRQRVARRASPGPLLHCCGLPARQSFACAGVPRRQFRAIIFYIRIWYELLDTNILNQSTGLSNQGFIPAFTYRITGSMSLPYQSGDLMNDLALCPCLKRDGSRCNSNLADNNFTHSIGYKSHGFHIKHHNVLEDTILGCCIDGLRSRIIRGQAGAYLNDDKRPRARGNLRVSIPCAPLGSLMRGTLFLCPRESSRWLCIV